MSDLILVSEKAILISELHKTISEDSYSIRHQMIDSGKEKSLHVF